MQKNPCETLFFHQALLFFLLGCLVSVIGVAGEGSSDVLPVEQAFKLDSRITDSEQVQLHWQIAEGYYLYRTRIKVDSPTSQLTLGTLSLPIGERKHDEYLGDMEIYHQELSAIQPIKVSDSALQHIELKITVQGCHEREPKICYPPFTQKVILELPRTANEQDSLNPNLQHDSSSTLPAQTVNPLAQLLNKNRLPNAAEPMPPLPPEQAFVFEAIATGPNEILARWTMPKGYYLYRDKTQLVSLQRLTNSQAAVITQPVLHWPKGVTHRDENFGESAVYFNQVEVPISFQRMSTTAEPATLNMLFQGCQDNGVCYPVMKRTITVELPEARISTVAATPAITSQPLTTSNNNELSEEQRLSASLSGSRLLALLSFFGFGLLLAFTPCVFPMIPILSGIIAGAGGTISTKRAFILSLTYVLASSLVFTIGGVIAGLAGKNLQALFQTPWILWSFAGLFVALALSMFGFYELQLPSHWQSKIASVSNRQKSGSLVGVAVMGILSTLIVGPCVAPPLAGAVLYISQTHDPFFGGIALFVLSLGMGAPLIAFGTTAGTFLPRAGVWMETIKSVFGVSFLALAVWMLSRILNPQWIMLMAGMLLVVCAIYLGALERLPENVSGWRKLWKALGVLLLLFGATELVGVMLGGQDILQPLKTLSIANKNDAPSSESRLPFKSIKSIADFEHELAAAKIADKPLLLDFYADWCVYCKEMDKFTFSNNEVLTALNNYSLLRADVTANDATDQALLQHFELFAPPATLFFGTDGSEQRALRLLGFEAADKFVTRINKSTH